MTHADIHAIAVSINDGEWFDDTKDMLKFARKIRNATLAAIRISTDHCTFTERKAHQSKVNYPTTDLYCPRCKCSEKFLQSRRCEPHIVYDDTLLQ